MMGWLTFFGFIYYCYTVAVQSGIELIVVVVVLNSSLEESHWLRSLSVCQ